MPLDSFKAKVDEWVCTLKHSKLQKGFDEILLPGEMALREEQNRLSHGVPIQEHYWNGICKMADELNIDLEALR
jgi:LDH2 family malate/lactate/ureidoglycolate dehydrogenase